MKNLLLFLLLASIVGLFLHDRQQSNDLTAARAQVDDLTQQNAELTRKLSEQDATYRRQIAGLEAQIRQLTAGAAQGSPASPFVPPAPGIQPGASNPLDRSPYR